VTRFKVGDRVAVPFILSCGECEYCRDGQPTACSSQEQPGFTRFGSFAEFALISRADRYL
jgi:alcohol dehydrogenase